MVCSKQVIQTRRKNKQHFRLLFQCLKQLVYSIYDQLFKFTGNNIRFRDKEIGDPVFDPVHLTAERSMAPTGKRAYK